ncbi:unnamed protein product [Caenorhabditis bovis]|uniref:[Phosphatase 2A protein]-leucine-carboxy methyltransferase 1 n=1 Tax=Caenorhabditis bovis TaxID=2654633 RepID=A0A8S1ELD8_9PELO|nr:unnamed protein product [Caenorhabditis bovis]
MDPEALSSDSFVAETIATRRRSSSVSDDYSVQRTNDDATQCKYYAVQKGYYKDDFIERFANTSSNMAETRRFPEISMGYWARTKIVEKFTVEYLRKYSGNAQIVSLGCGFDTLFWRLAASGEKLAKFVEVDFSSVTSKKIRHIMKPANGPDPTKLFTEKRSAIVQHSDLHAGNYHLVGADLRQLNEFHVKLNTCNLDKSLPTIFIAECVLVYMSAQNSADLLKSLSEAFKTCAFVNYEQFRTSDSFTRVMEKNLGDRGIHLHGLQMCESDEKQILRFKTAGFSEVGVYDMNVVFKKLLDQSEVERIKKIELLDEIELLEQLLAHYCNIDVPMKWLRRRSVRHKLLLILACVILFAINKYYTQPVEQESAEIVVEETKNECETPEIPDIQTIKCSADNGKPMSCWKNDEDVFLPFSYIRKRFDMSGKLSKDATLFEIFTSYSKMRVPDEKYNPLGVFGHFATYNVERRERVRCISAETDVPMSTQWNPKPYYYPIQIAQYGLQHYSRIKSGSRKMLEVLKGEKSVEWKGAAGMHETTERLFYKDEELGFLVNISTGDAISNAGAYVYLDKSSELHVLSFEWKPMNANASFTVLAKMRDGDLLVLLNYVMQSGNGKCVWNDDVKEKDTFQRMRRKDDQVSYSYSYSAKVNEWNSVTRDILVDVSRALSSAENRKKNDNIVLHPDWLVENQDSTGGWPVPVERSIAERKLVLPPGWHSAMAQGHGLSVLTRAYKLFDKEKYLDAAIRGIDLFKKNSSDGGVVAHFFDVPWYEEYPTTPGSFVLNGFMYSLIGLYDMSQLTVPNANSTVSEAISQSGELYRTGIGSLRKLLPLFDTGSGTIYDLRHVGLATAPNLARWDYHAVHVYLLKWIANIENDEYFGKTADRWIDYAYGRKAKHN